MLAHLGSSKPVKPGSWQLKTKSARSLQRLNALRHCCCYLPAVPLRTLLKDSTTAAQPSDFVERWFRLLFRSASTLDLYGFIYGNRSCHSCPTTGTCFQTWRVTKLPKRTCISRNPRLRASFFTRSASLCVAATTDLWLTRLAIAAKNLPGACMHMRW